MVVSLNSVASGIDISLEEAGVITGTINDINGDPLLGVPVGVNVFSGNPCGALLWVTGSGINTENGTYVIAGIPPGTYYLDTWNNGTMYIDEYWTGASGDPSDRDCSLAQTITVVAGETETNKNFQLEEGGAITGTINGSHGQPLLGELVGAIAYSGDPCGEFHHVIGNGINTEDGTYTINGIPPGTYYLKTWNGDAAYTNEWWADTASTSVCTNAETIVVIAGVTEGNKDFQLNADSDRDELPDDWEELHYGDIGSVDLHTDSDGDGLNAREEVMYGTDPFSNDSDNDGITDNYEVWTAGTDPADPSDTPPIPLRANIANHHESNDEYFTLVELVINDGFSRTDPNDIDTITIIGPGLNLNKNDMLQDSINCYYRLVSGSPELGEFVFSVTSGSATGTTSDTQSENHEIPLVDLTVSFPSVEETIHTLNPLIRWNLVDYPAIPLSYYQCRIYNMSGSRLYQTNAIQDLTHCIVPDGVLAAGETYELQVRIYDDFWPDVQNRALSRANFTVATDAVSVGRGDVNGDGQVNLADTILGLQVMTGMDRGVHMGSDITPDGKVGMEEAIFTIQHVADN